LPIAKEVFVINSLSSWAGIIKGESPESMSKIGKSELGKVDSEYLPFVVFRLNLSPVRLKLISSPSGINLHSSFNFFADVVVFPDDLTLDNGPLVVT